MKSLLVIIALFAAPLAFIDGCDWVDLPNETAESTKIDQKG